MTVGRRQRGALAVGLITLAATACAAGDTNTPSAAHRQASSPATHSSTSSPRTGGTVGRPAPGSADPYARPGWVAAENRRPGTTAWQIHDDTKNPVFATPTAWVDAYADSTSAINGQTVTLFVDTPAPKFHVFAYRMGWYGGARGRLVWSSAAIAGGRQPLPAYDSGTRMAEAPWNPSLEFTITDQWPPGSYLLKVASSTGGAHYVPLTIRDDAATGSLLFMSAVTTWQAYNPWGGCTLYQCFPPLRKGRADVVSFDRPYSHAYGKGSADFLTHELPLIAFIEQHGFDVGYITDIDLHRDPALAASRRAVISPGHDEYYSWPMRQGLVSGIAAGTNLAFFGANAVYRNIRFGNGVRGQSERRMANYRSRHDPGAGSDPHLVTVNWSQAPLELPESRIVGLQYGCSGVTTSMRLVNPTSWLLTGTGATSGQMIPGIVGIEVDTLPSRNEAPPGLDVIASTPIACGRSPGLQSTGYYSTESGAGVFDAGTINWGCGLDGTCAGIPASDVVRGITLNVLQAFTAGPAGVNIPGRAPPSAVAGRAGTAADVAWFTRPRRHAAIEPQVIDAVLRRNVRLATGLPTEQHDRLRELTAELVTTKSWEGVGGLVASDEIKVTIAANAALPILTHDTWPYRNVSSIIVRPTTTVSAGRRAGPVAGTFTDDTVGLVGEATPNHGPVALSWDTVLWESRYPEEGGNVVIHEFAHKIDMNDGYADGVPPLRGVALDQWRVVLNDEYHRSEPRDSDSVLRPYAWASPAEFFAVASEAFFCIPHDLRAAKPALFDALGDLYRQDPTRWRPRPARPTDT